MVSATFFSTLNRSLPLRFLHRDPFCQVITASLHSSQKKTKTQTKFLMPITLKKANLAALSQSGVH